MDVKNKHVTFLIGSLSGGGSEGVCVNLANALSTRGWNVDLVCINLKRKDYIYLVNDSVNLINLEAPRFLFSIPYILKYLYRSRPSVIVTFHYYIAVVMVLLKYIFHFKFNLIARNNISLTHAVYSKSYIVRMLFPIVSFLYRRVDYIISQCFEMEQDLISNFKFSPKKIGVIHNPVRNEIQSYIFNKEDYIREDYILCVGRLAAQKQFDHAIEVFSRIRHKFPNLKLKIIGYGEEQKKLVELSKQLDLVNYIKFIPFNSQICTYYYNAKATLLTSKFEGFPNVLIESISIGTPVLSYACPTGPSEIVVNNTNGFLVPLNDKDKLYFALEKLLSKEWSRDTIKHTAKKFYSSNIYDKYETLLGNKCG